MSIIAECNDRVAAAQRRMLARQARLREVFLVLKDSWGATLTQPLVLGGAVLGGFMLSGRRRSAPAKVECECKTRGGPTLLRSLVTALLVPIIEHWMGAARQRSTATDTAADTVASTSTAEMPVRE